MNGFAEERAGLMSPGAWCTGLGKDLEKAAELDSRFKPLVARMLREFEEVGVDINEHVGPQEWLNVHDVYVRLAPDVMRICSPQVSFLDRPLMLMAIGAFVNVVGI